MEPLVPRHWLIINKVATVICYMIATMAAINVILNFLTGG